MYLSPQARCRSILPPHESLTLAFHDDRGISPLIYVPNVAPDFTFFPLFLTHWPLRWKIGHSLVWIFNLPFFFKRFYLFIFTERGREGERDEKRHHCERETFIGCLSHSTRLKTQPATPSTCPDWESNRQPFALQDDAPPTESLCSGWFSILLIWTICNSLAFSLPNINFLFLSDLYWQVIDLKYKCN